ncbi:alpha-2-macroglobulin-like [Lethenteron reissneri]|uniref:alpha-2-macroglobulin-like n=1 Tax=Lethenteron reissneri TaxID=7753 RepID=UPI002AB76CCE|nr:alpha-2-macroglobulin-like [Lethenteron reissneri]
MGMAGHAFLLLLCALAAVVSADEQSSGHYLVFVPSELHALSSERLCVSLLGVTGEVTFRATLHYKDSRDTSHVAQNHTVVGEVDAGVLLQPSGGDLHHCFSFTVPDVQGTTYANLVVRAAGEGLNFTKTHAVVVRKAKDVVFVQTDKPVYKPGQSVKFRVVTLDENFATVLKTYALIYIEDPQRNRIAQWRNASGRAGIVQLELDMPSEPPLGTYNVMVVEQSGGDSVASHTFTVEEYVLPTFEVSIQTPSYLNYLDKSVTLKVCGRYTYGKPVHGAVNASVCIQGQPRFWWREECIIPVCNEFFMKVGKDGCAEWQVDNAKPSNASCHTTHVLKVVAVLEEEGTGMKMKQKAEKNFETDITRISFVDMPSWYRHGLPIVGKVKVERPDGSPVPHKLVSLIVKQGNAAPPGSQHHTGADGTFTFTIDTGDFNRSDTIFLEATDPEFNSTAHPSVTYQQGYSTISAFFSPSDSFLQLDRVAHTLECGSSVSLRLLLVLKENRSSAGDGHAGGVVRPVINVLVMSRGNILHTESFTMDNVYLGKAHSHHFQLKVKHSFAPTARLLAWMVFNNETVADTLALPVHKCFPNKVSVGFEHEQELPGAMSTLSIRASPGSLCALRVVDKSVLLLKPEAQLSAESIFQRLQVQDLTYYDYGIERWDCSPEHYRRRKRSYGVWMDDFQNSVHRLFKGMGLVVLTDTTVKRSVDCHQLMHHRHRIAYSMETVASPGLRFSDRGNISPVGQGGAMFKTVKETVREYFPETWIWDLYPVSESGLEQVAVKVPDSITEWKASAFCSSPAGFGLSEVSSLRVFTPFFVEPVLPYSVVRGETFPLAISVHNYLHSCLKIEVTLLDSEHFAVAAGGPRGAASCVCPDRKGLFSFLIEPLALGTVNVSVRAAAVHSDEPCGNEVVVVPEEGAVDTVVRSVIVEPEGIPKELAYSSLLCPKSPASERFVFNLPLPANVIVGSARAYATIAGDIMGSALQNLDKLLTLPTGCGEQNMVKFAPNIYIQEYLQNSGQLTDAVRDKALNFLRVGYQRQLTYKRDDHSYSAFGKSDDDGNTWLTAFVLKSFVRASKHIAVSEDHITGPFSWLVEHQNASTGCFISVGRLFNNAMKGGVSDDVSLTAYVTAALLESNISGPVVERALGCLRPLVLESSNPHLLALASYAFSLSADGATAQALRDALQSRAVTKGGLTHWQEANKKDDKDEEDEEGGFNFRRSYGGTTSAAVETTAYALLSRLAVPGQLAASATSSNIGVVQWLSKQRNAYGGFSSTQDTVVGLQALSAFAALMHGGGGGGGGSGGIKAVVLDSAHTLLREVSIDSTNALILHQVQLPPPVPAPMVSSCTVEATGQGCVLFQVSLKYNEPPKSSKPKFILSVETNPANCSKAARKGFQINVEVSYHGERGESNMALVEVKMISGYSAVKSSLKELQTFYDFVKKVEVDASRVVIYLDKVDKKPIAIKLSVTQDIAVDNLQPATVRVYDYYATEDAATSMYSAPCTHSQ